MNNLITYAQSLVTYENIPAILIGLVAIYFIYKSLKGLAMVAIIILAAYIAYRFLVG